MSTFQMSHTSIRELRNILKFQNPETGNFTCVGHAPSQRRRCRNPIAQHNQAAADRMLEELLQASSEDLHLDTKLHTLACLALCKRNHQNQASEVARKWRPVIAEEIRRLPAPHIHRHGISRNRILVEPRYDRRDEWSSVDTTGAFIVPLMTGYNGSRLRPSGTDSGWIRIDPPFERLHGPAPRLAGIDRVRTLIEPPTNGNAPQNLRLANPIPARIVTEPPVNGDASPHPHHPARTPTGTHPIGQSSPHLPLSGTDPRSVLTEPPVDRRSAAIPRSATTNPGQTVVATPTVNTENRVFQRHGRQMHPTVSVQSEEQLPAETSRRNQRAPSRPTMITDENDECPICYEPFENPWVTPRGHKYCYECISLWLRAHNTGPHDRRPLRLEELTPVETTTAEALSCPICYEDSAELCRTPCGHTFCRPCITRWLDESLRGTCPLDRRPLRAQDLVSITDS